MTVTRLKKKKLLNARRKIKAYRKIGYRSMRNPTSLRIFIGSCLVMNSTVVLLTIFFIFFIALIISNWMVS